MTAMAALIRCQRAWERTQPQLFLELGPLEEAPGPQLTGVRGRGTGVSSSGPYLQATPPPPGGRSNKPTTAARPQNLGRDLRGRAAKGA